MKPSRPTLVFEPSSSSNGDTQMDGDLFTARDVAALRITELDDDKQAFTTHPQIPASEQRLSLYSSSQHHHVYARPSVVPPQGHSILSLDESTHGLPGESQSGMDIIMAQQEQLKQLKEQAQQLQQQLEDSLQKRQQLQQQLDESLQKAQQQQQQIHAMNQNGHPPGHSSEKQGHQAMPQRMPDTSHLRKLALDRLLAIQKDIYSKPNLDSREMSYPRLFVVLPTTACIADRQDESYANQFSLHFLCECGFHTMSKKSIGMHAIHLTQHPGYALNNPSEFFEKYGSYLLSMLYMIKYGAKTEGFVVPPSTHLGTTTDQDDFDVTKSTGRLVDEMTVHLEEHLGNNMAVTTQKALDASELEHLVSYLKTESDEGTSGDLKQTITQDGHSVWICSKHIREYHDSILHRFKELITANGERYWKQGNNETQIEFQHICDTQQKGLYDAIVNICRTQSAGNQRSLAVLDLRNGFHHSTLPIINLDIFSTESLVLKFGRLSMSVGTTHDRFKDVAMTIWQLCNLTSDDIKFLRRCRPVFVTVIGGQDGVEDRLVDILQHNPRIAELHIRDCQFKNALAIIDRVISARTKTAQNGSLAAPLIFKTMSSTGSSLEENITTTVRFSEGCSEYAYEMETTIRQSWYQPYGNVNSFECDFYRRYGWSIKTLILSRWSSDLIASTLDESTRVRSSMIEHLNATPTALTTCGMDALDRFIKRSQNFLSVELTLENLQDRTQLEKALLVLQRYKDRLKSLTLTGMAAESWLPQLARALPSKDSLPMMESFTIEQLEENRGPKLERDRSSAGQGLLQHCPTMDRLHGFSPRTTIASAEKLCVKKNGS